ncbi:FtsW/RodA/SpoVE family cell cycle protein [Bacillus sp. 165]|uniref:FtsW/RodA/SpoVE family cell cycle protein n=1 Tax=Bacillus sp. 165 TaxID=1529117 RepID=UPI001ADB2895|nr:FtsW/RodA/SpoVE family cell cycle protein [Bacillus sp. 165]MBO9130304.1 FtsW/RodA/SpoVE family cell cycle protein [Bacillus sp. 165]
MKKIIKSMDYPLVTALFVLCALGVIMVYSASMAPALLKYKVASDYFFKRQLMFLVTGAAGCFIVMRFSYSILKKRVVALIIYISSIGLLGIARIMGEVVNNAKAWVFGFQPSEFIKLGIIIVLARFYAKRQETDLPIWRGAGVVWGFVLLVVILVVLQPDMGTGLLIMSIAATMTLCSGIRIGVNLKRIGLLAPLWLPLGYFAALAVLTDEQISRFTAFINPFLSPEDDGFHLINSFVAIADGGLKGLGLGDSEQKWGYLPEPHTDFIMAIISEELGVLGVAVVLASLAFIVLRAFQVARKCTDPFGSLLAIGIGSMIGIQAVVNIGGITGALPLTGVPVPFVSYGGSSLIINLAAMGVLLNISAQVKQQEQKRKPQQQKNQQRHLVVVK